MWRWFTQVDESPASAPGRTGSASDLDLTADLEDPIGWQLEEPAGAVGAPDEQHEEVLEQLVHALGVALDGCTIDGREGHPWVIAGDAFAARLTDLTGSSVRSR